MDITKIQQKLSEFAQERDWEQFHSPKNLAMALAGESGELLEIFQWLTEEQSKAIKENAGELKKVEEELADIFLYLLRLATQLDIDMEKAAWDKITLNAQKYPIEKAKGIADKYTSF